MKRLFSLLAIIALFATQTQAQITLDGTITESSWSLPLATSVGGPTPGFGAGHELNAFYFLNDPTNLYFALAGNVQDGNRILLFIDYQAGGFGTANFGRSSAPGGLNNFNSGTTFDAGFEPDACLCIGTDAARSQFYFDLYPLSGNVNTASSGGPNLYLGSNLGLNPLLVNSGIAVGANPANGSQTSGFEAKIPKSILGILGNATIKVMAMYIGNSGFLSNQFLTRAGSSDGNYTGGAVNFSAATPNPIVITPIPVVLSSFTANKQSNGTNLLVWQTQSEANASHFEIQRANNASDWTTIGSIKANGTSRTTHQYRFSDDAPLSATNYYRLKQVDFDNKVNDYSNVVSVLNNAAASKEFQVYPNPVNDVLTVGTFGEVVSTIEMLDLQGRVVKTVSVVGNTYNVSDLPQGVYLLRTLDANGTTLGQARFVKQ